MSRDCIRHIEYKSYDVDKVFINYKDLILINDWQVGDYVIVYSTSEYYKIVSIDENKKIMYELINQPKTIEELSAWNPNIVYHCNKLSELPKYLFTPNEGDIYKTWNSGEVFYKVVNNELKEISKELVPATWKHAYWNEDSYIYTGVNSFVDKYICEDSSIYRKGAPNDITKITEDDIMDGYNITWCSLSELKDIYDKEFEKFKSYIKEYAFNSNVNKLNDKLDNIINILKKNNNIKNTIEDDIDEDELNDNIWDFTSIQHELDNIEFVVRNFCKNYTDIRIIYFIC